MNSFRFRLERILRWRALELSNEERRVKELMEKDAQITARLDLLQRQKAEVDGGIRGLEQLHGRDLNALAAFAVHSLAQRQALERQRREIQQAVRQQLQRHRTAKQRFRALEELKKRQFSDWQGELARELDELAADSHRARSYSADSLLLPEA